MVTGARNAAAKLRATEKDRLRETSASEAGGHVLSIWRRGAWPL